MPKEKVDKRMNQKGPQGASAASAAASPGPKRAKTGPGRPARDSGETAQSAPMPMQVSDGSTINAEVWLKHGRNVQVVQECPIFMDAASMKPLGIASEGNGNAAEDTGAQAAFVQAAALQSLKTHGKYMSGGNAAWVNPYHSTSANIPLMWTSVEDRPRET